ncbi:MAG: glycosyltransferase family 2 protein [Pseudomonadota bacterium]
MSVVPLQPAFEPGPISNSPARPGRAAKPRAHRDLLLDLLVSLGHISGGERVQATHMARLHGTTPLEVLVAEGWLSAEALLSARCNLMKASRIDPERAPADPALIEDYGLHWCITHGVLPWRRMSGATVFITAAPEEFETLKDSLPASAGRAILAVAPQQDVIEALRSTHAGRLVAEAESAVPGKWSCRGLKPPQAALWLLTMALGAAFLMLVPGLMATTLVWITLGTLAVTMAFKLILTLACLLARPPPPTQGAPRGNGKPLPRMTMLVPLLRESEVAAKLLNNLDRLRYPRALLEVIFVVEADDDVTKNALSQLHLPQSFRMLEVPAGTVQTKPRALNFALPFCKGEVIGIYDAEDRPDPDQLLKVAEGFRHAEPEVACLQGRLDFFNTRYNIVARCFTAEYAGWFGLMLQGLDRLRLPIPLGGTTLFLRRDALDRTGPWDAHNVTEDADLGMRFYRFGYRVQLIDTVTQEEANVRIWPWIKQRSRWIKGYMATYVVHMRTPVQLWRDLGPAGFASMQCLFLGSILGALTLPILFTIWAVSLGVPVPVLHSLAIPAPWVLGPTMLGIEAINLLIWAIGVRAPRHRNLMPMVPLLHIYFLMSTVAALKALIELLHDPFYWDKTDHGVAVHAETVDPD